MKSALVQKHINKQAVERMCVIQLELLATPTLWMIVHELLYYLYPLYFLCFIITHSLDQGICGCVLHRHTLSMIFACCWGYLHCKSESMGNIASSGAKNRIQEGKSLGIG